MTALTGSSADPTVPAVTGTHTGGGMGVHGSSDSFEGVHGDSKSTDTAAVSGINNTAPGSIGVYGESDPGRGVVGISKTFMGVYGSSDSFEGVHGDSKAANAAAVSGINSSTGIGVYGKSASGDAGFFDGNVTVVGAISFGGADCAEEFDVVEGVSVEPGTVMVLTSEGALRPSSVAYDNRVAGVVSGAGEYEPALVLDRQPRAPGRARIALMGKAYCKVDAANGPISAGDLLTTSLSPGCAMPVSDHGRAVGAVIGKALLPWSKGRGLIPILVALQ